MSRACNGSGAHDVPLFLALEAVFPRELAQEPRMIAALEAAYDAIGDEGNLP